MKDSNSARSIAQSPRFSRRQKLKDRLLGIRLRSIFIDRPGELVEVNEELVEFEDMDVKPPIDDRSHRILRPVLKGFVHVAESYVSDYLMSSEGGLELIY